MIQVPGSQRLSAATGPEAPCSCTESEGPGPDPPADLELEPHKPGQGPHCQWQARVGLGKPEARAGTRGPRVSGYSVQTVTAWANIEINGPPADACV